MFIRGCAIGVFLALGILLSGCAIGNKHQYSEAQPNFVAMSTVQLALAVQDQRPYVIDGDKGADFVGVQRGGFGNPFDVTTQSKRPLAEDFSAVVAKALSKKQIATTIVSAAPAATLSGVKTALQATGAERLLLISVKQWKSDTYSSTALIYDLTLFVFGHNGTLMAQNALSGNEDLGGSFMNPPAHAKTAVPQAFTRILADLFNDTKIVAALK